MLARRNYAIFTLLAVLAGGAALLQNAQQNALAPHDMAIRDVIRQQIEAFGRDDAATAFSFASPDLKAQFGALGPFMSMIKMHYRSVYLAHKIEFRERSRVIQIKPEMRAQNIYLIDDHGIGHEVRYIMQKQPDDLWKMAGCLLLEKKFLDI